MKLQLEKSWDEIKLTELVPVHVCLFVFVVVVFA